MLSRTIQTNKYSAIRAHKALGTPTRIRLGLKCGHQSLLGIRETAGARQKVGKMAAVMGDGGEHRALLDLVLNWAEVTAGGSPLGWLAVYFIIVTGELVPLLPTQPFALISGLVFGAGKGAALTLFGTTTAASLAFLLASGPLGAKLTDLAMKLDGEEGNSTNPLLKRLGSGVADMHAGKQILSVVVLRLSPVVPFSLSNYVLGLSPIRLLPFSLGTFVGMAPWCILYSTLGAGAATFLESDGDISKILTTAQQELGSYSQQLELLGAATVFMFLVFLFNTLRYTEGDLDGDLDSF